MNLLKRFDDIKESEVESVYLLGKITQYGSTPAIFNADLNGEQKQMFDQEGDSRLILSAECVTNGVFKHRKKSSPKLGEGKKAKKEKDTQALANFFEWIKQSEIPLRGDTVMEKDVLNTGASKSLKIDVSWERKSTKSSISNNNNRLGIKANDGKNDYPREIVGYTNCEFSFSANFDCQQYLKNDIVREFLSLVEESKDEELKNSVGEWLEKNYPVDKDGVFDYKKVVERIVKEMKSYRHPVQQKYNPNFVLEIESCIEVKNTEDLHEVYKKVAEHQAK